MFAAIERTVKRTICPQQAAAAPPQPPFSPGCRRHHSASIPGRLSAVDRRSEAGPGPAAADRQGCRRAARGTSKAQFSFHRTHIPILDFKAAFSSTVREFAEFRHSATEYEPVLVKFHLKVPGDVTRQVNDKTKQIQICHG